MIRRKELTGRFLIKTNWSGLAVIRVEANVWYSDEDVPNPEDKRSKWLKPTEEDLIELNLIGVKTASL